MFKKNHPIFQIYEAFLSPCDFCEWTEDLLKSLLLSLINLVGHSLQTDLGKTHSQERLNSPETRDVCLHALSIETEKISPGFYFLFLAFTRPASFHFINFCLWWSFESPSPCSDTTSRLQCTIGRDYAERQTGDMQMRRDEFDYSSWTVPNYPEIKTSLSSRCESNTRKLY